MKEKSKYTLDLIKKVVSGFFEKINKIGKPLASLIIKLKKGGKDKGKEGGGERGRERENHK